MNWARLLFSTAIFLLPLNLSAQRQLVFTERPHFVAGMYNMFFLADCAEKMIVERVFMETVDHYLDNDLPRDTLEVTPIYGGYRITPPREARLGIVVRMGEILDTTYRSVKPLPAAVYLGNASWRRDSLPATVAKAQSGIYAQVEGYDIDAKCLVEGYSFTRVSFKGYQTIYNEGGNFQQVTRTMMDELKAGDILLIRNITYRCGGTAEAATARDLIISIY